MVIANHLLIHIVFIGDTHCSDASITNKPNLQLLQIHEKRF